MKKKNKKKTITFFSKGHTVLPDSSMGIFFFFFLSSGVLLKGHQIEETQISSDPKLLHADREDSDRTEIAQIHSLIWIFAGCTCHFVGFVLLRLIIYLFTL